MEINEKKKPYKGVKTLDVIIDVLESGDFVCPCF